MMRLVRGFAVMLCGFGAVVPHAAYGQTIDLQALQDQADAAAAQAQDELRDTDVVFVLTRALGDGSWSFTIDGVIAGNQINIDGSATIVSDPQGHTSLELLPSFPEYDILADLGTPALESVEFAILNAPDSQTELVVWVGADLEDSADPERFDGIDVSTLPKLTTITRTSSSPKFHVVRDGVTLSVADSYKEMVQTTGLRKPDAEAYFRGELDALETIEAFRNAAVDNLAPHGISEQTARDIFDLRLQHGTTQTYYTEAFALIVSRGEPVSSILQNGMSIDDPEGPLSTSTADPGDIIITLSGTVEVEVAVPPFVKAKASVTVSVSGPASDYAELQQQLEATLSAVRPVIEQQIRDQLEELGETIESLVALFKEHLSNIHLPRWLEWILN